MKALKYLERQALTGTICGRVPNPDEIRQIVIIPARGEDRYLPDCLQALAANPEFQCRHTWCLIVVNNPPPGCPGYEYYPDNQRTIAWLKRQSASNHLPAISFIDASSPGRETAPRYGVGRARKIGSDTAIRHLFRESSARARLAAARQVLLFHLDADTLVAPDYLTASRRSLHRAQADSGVIHFEHQAGGDSDSTAKAINRYELFMRCYVQGLYWAGSPYAFHTVGSTIVSTVEGYIQAGGMPAKRTAGEDFYFVQQLNKTGRLIRINTTAVYPSSRPSIRVPFGTGRQVAAALAEQKPEEKEIFDPPESFLTLRCLLEIISRNLEAEAETIAALLQEKSPLAGDFLHRRKFASVWRRFRDRCGGRPAAMARAFDQWFDALATRQLISAAAPRKLNFREAWPRWVETAGRPPFAAVREALYWMREQDKTMPPSRPPVRFY